MFEDAMQVGVLVLQQLVEPMHGFETSGLPRILQKIVAPSIDL